MEANLRRELLTKLSNLFLVEQIKQIDNVLTTTLVNYEIKEKCTDVIIHSNDIPNEIKSFLVCKSIKGLTETSKTICSTSKKIR